jgi:hypothetical protein
MNKIEKRVMAGKYFYPNKVTGDIEVTKSGAVYVRSERGNRRLHGEEAEQAKALAGVK